MVCVQGKHTLLGGGVVLFAPCFVHDVMRELGLWSYIFVL